MTVARESAIRGSLRCSSMWRAAASLEIGLTTKEPS
jgi:hypothetical protein